MLAHRVPEIDAYVQELGIEQTVVAAVSYAQWSVAAEYRLLAFKGIHVDEISLRDLEPFLGRGRTPVLENALLGDLIGMGKHTHEQVAWAQEEDDAFGCDRYVMIISVLRQLYKRYGQHRPTTKGERWVVRVILAAHDNSTDLLESRGSFS